MSVVADTHAALWYLLDSPRLSARALERMTATIASGAVILVPSISIVEFVYLTEKGRIPTLARDRFEAALTDPGSSIRIVPLTLGIAQDLTRVPWKAVPDMPDRIIAATALHLGLPLVSRDSRMQVPGLEVVW